MKRYNRKKGHTQRNEETRLLAVMAVAGLAIVVILAVVIGVCAKQQKTEGRNGSPDSSVGGTGISPGGCRR